MKDGEIRQLLEKITSQREAYRDLMQVHNHHRHHVIFVIFISKVIILHHHIIRVRSPSSRHYIVIILTQFIIILSSSSCKMRPLIGISCCSCITIVITLRYHIIIYHCHMVDTALSRFSYLFLRKAFISLQLTLSKSAQYFSAFNL